MTTATSDSLGFYSDAYKDEYGTRPILPVSQEEVDEYFAGRDARVKTEEKRREDYWRETARRFYGAFRKIGTLENFDIPVYAVNTGEESDGEEWLYVAVYDTYMKAGFAAYSGGMNRIIKNNGDVQFLDFMTVDIYRKVKNRQAALSWIEDRLGVRAVS